MKATSIFSHEVTTKYAEAILGLLQKAYLEVVQKTHDLEYTMRILMFSCPNPIAQYKSMYRWGNPPMRPNHVNRLITPPRTRTPHRARVETLHRLESKLESKGVRKWEEIFSIISSLIQVCSSIKRSCDIAIHPKNCHTGSGKSRPFGSI